MKKIVIISILLVLSTITSYSQTIGFITMKDGYESALELVKQNFPDVKLVAVFTGNREVVLPMGGITLTGEIKFEDDDIGKANFWSYVFYDSVTENHIEITSVKVIPMGGAIKSVESEIFINEYKLPLYYDYAKSIDEIVDSDMFIKKVVENKSLDIPDDPNVCLINPVPSSEPLTITISVATRNTDYEDILTLWEYGFACGDMHEYCCSEATDLASLFYCYNYENIMKNDLLEISIIPNPTMDEIIIKTDENIDKIDISNLDGTLINSYISNSIDVSNYATGTYFIKFYVNNRIIVKPFIKE